MKGTLKQTWHGMKIPWISFDLKTDDIVDFSELVPEILGIKIKKGFKFNKLETDLKLSADKKLDSSLIQAHGTHSIPNWFGEYNAVFSLWKSEEAEGCLIMLYAPDKSKAYNDLFDKNVSGVYKISLDGNIVKCNEAFARILGEDSYTSLIGKSVSEFYHNPNERKNFLDRIISEKFIQNYEIILRKKSGELAWAIENSYLIQEQDQTLIAGTLIEMTQEKLNEQRLSLLFHESTEAIILLQGLDYIDCNQRALEIFGYKREDLLARNPKDSLSNIFVDDPDKAELLKLKIEKVMNGENQKIQTVLRRQDGSLFHGEVYFVPFQVLDTNYVQIIVHDVSERVLFEDTIRESEERFKLISNVAIEGVVFVDEGFVVDCNDQFAKLTGWRSRESMVGKRINEFILEEDLKRLQHLIEAKTINRLEVRGKKESGQAMILEASASSINYLNKELQAFLFYDITSRKKAEQALEQSIDRFKGLVENSPNAVFILTDGRIRYSNNSGIKLLGYSDEDDVYDAEFVELFTAKDRKDIKSDLKKVREGDEVSYRELKIVDRYKNDIDVGIKSTLTVYDYKPSIQVTINNLSTERLLVQEKMRAQLAEEINHVLKTEIQEHKETQTKLEAAQRFTRNIIESSLDMIIAVDSERKISEFNPAARQFFGYKPNEIIGKPIRSLYSTDEVWDSVHIKMIQDGYFSGEIENIKKNGEVFTSFLSASLIRDQKGKVIGSMGVSRDITEFKKAEEKLRKSEERFRDIFENVQDFILSIDLNGNIQYSNKAFKESIGYSGTELEKTSIFKLCDPKQLNKKKSLIDQLSQKNLTLTLTCKGGDKIIVRGNANVRYENDMAVSFRAIFRNVTEVVEQRAKLESIFNSTENILMWTVDKKHRLTSFNKNLESVWKRDFGTAIKTGIPFIELMEKKVNEDFYQGQLDDYDKVFGGEPRQFEVPFLNSKGENVWLQFFLNPVYYADKLEEVSCMAYDVTDRKEIDRRILDALKEKEVLLQEVHHRVKNNLQVISSILNLQSGYVTDTGTLEILKESQNRIKSMSYIHETLYQTADFGSIEFSDYINSISRNLIHSYTTDAPVQLITDLDRICLSIDQAIPCGLIINELVSNALKYAFKNIQKPSLLVKIKEQGKSITLQVKDNGIGLPENFGFEKSNSLGVQLVYSLVEQLDGNIIISSEKGTDIIITFDQL